MKIIDELSRRIAELEAENKRLRGLVGTAWNDGLCTGFERALSAYNANKRAEFLRVNGLGEG